MGHGKVVVGGRFLMGCTCGGWSKGSGHAQARPHACNSGAVWATEAGSRQHPDMHLAPGRLGSTTKVDLVLACRVSLQVRDCHSGQRQGLLP